MPDLLRPDLKEPVPAGDVGQGPMVSRHGGAPCALRRRRLKPWTAESPSLQPEGEEW